MIYRIVSFFLVVLLFAHCAKEEVVITPDFTIDGQEVEAHDDKGNPPNRLISPAKVATVQINETIEIACTSTPDAAVESRIWKIDLTTLPKVEKTIEYTFTQKGYHPITLNNSGQVITKWVYVTDGQDESIESRMSQAPEEVAIKDTPNPPPTQNTKNETPPIAQSKSKKEESRIKKSPQRESNNRQSQNLAEKSTKKEQKIVQKTQPKPEPVPQERRPSKVDFRLPSNSIEVGETISLSDLSSPSSKIDQRKWDFGDQNTKVTSGKSVTYQYMNPGSYTIRLCINDNPKDCISKNINVTKAAPPVVVSKPKEESKPSEKNIPTRKDIKTSIDQGKKATTSAEKETTEKAKEVVEKKVESALKPFKCNSRNLAGARSDDKCTRPGQERWVKEATISLKATTRMELLEGKISAQKAGSLQIELIENGQVIGEINPFVNEGVNQVILDGFYAVLDPTKEYKLKIRGKGDQQIEDLRDCNPNIQSTNQLSLKYDNVVLMDLKYCYP